VVIYRDRPSETRVIEHPHRYEHVYRDRHDRIRHRLIYPRFHFTVGYHWGPRFSYYYVWPYYHRKYVFVSLGGYWPFEYRYVRYYRYGCHPYRWYGYYPIAHEPPIDTYNYYTYNYYYDSSGRQIATDIGAGDYVPSVAVQPRQPNEPLPEGVADKYFERGVDAFEDGDYFAAAESFAEAARLAPDDMILPFAYSQALMASGQYEKATDILRIALLKTNPENRGVFYPRGLYAEDDVLLEQVAQLGKRAEQEVSNANLQLLLGYQLLGLGKIDEAAGPLERARLAPVNAVAADVLLDLLRRIKYESPPANKDIDNTDATGDSSQIRGSGILDKV